MQEGQRRCKRALSMWRSSAVPWQQTRGLAAAAARIRPNAPVCEPMTASYDEKDYLGRLDAMIKTNLDLISHRMGWLLISQSFLFTAFALAAAHVQNPLADRLSLGVFVHLVPLLGLAIALFVGLSLLAAMRVIWTMKATRARIEATLTRPLEETYGAASVPRTSLTDWVGHAPALAVPPLFAAAWLYLLLS